MIPVFFPFTSISKNDRASLSLWFHRIAIYRPATPKAGETDLAGIEIRVPLHQDENRLEAMCKSFREWGLLHRPEDLALLKITQQEESRLVGEKTASQIRNALRRCQEPETDSQVDVQMQARIFLQLAQEFDQQQAEIGRGIRSAEVMEREMVRNLMGTAVPVASAQPSIVPQSPSFAHDPGAYMTVQRLAAWTCLLNQDTHDNVLFITQSRAVLESLLESAPEMNRIATFAQRPVHAEDIRAATNPFQVMEEALVRLLRAPVDAPLEQISVPFPEPNPEQRVGMDLFRVAGLSPQRFFSRFAAPDVEKPEPREPSSSFSDTLIGIITTPCMDE